MLLFLIKLIKQCFYFIHILIGKVVAVPINSLYLFNVAFNGGYLYFLARAEDYLLTLSFKLIAEFNFLVVAGMAGQNQLGNFGIFSSENCRRYFIRF